MVWVKVKRLCEQEQLDKDSYSLVVPTSIAQNLHSTVTVNFGQGSVKAVVKVNSETTAEKNDFHHPIIIEMGDQLIDELLIETSIKYQLRFSTDEIHLGPVIGLLLGEQQYYYHDRYMKEFTDALSAYKKVGGLFIAFKSCSIDWSKRVIYGMYYNDEHQNWLYGRFPFPSVIYRRAFKSTDDEVNVLKAITNGKVFNSVRLNKWEVHTKMSTHPFLKNFLPDTIKLDQLDELSAFMRKYENIILKPVALSRARGICIVKKVDVDTVLLYDLRQDKSGKPLKLSTLDFYEYLRKKHFFSREYIVQPHLKLSKINGSPWDIRIVMQRTDQKKWKCHGIECRVAGSTSLITNISQGGRALSVNKAAKLAFGSKIHPAKLKKDIIQISKEFCKMMDETGERFVEFGIDIALDEEMNYWFIEANVRPTFNGFKTINYSNYLHICSTPIMYAASVAGFGRGEKVEKG